MRRVWRAWQRGGWRLAARVVCDRIADHSAERRLGIDSAGLIPIETLLKEWHECHDYFPTTIRDFRMLMDDLAIAEDDVFLDLGSGKGRVLLLAAQHPFRRVIGVEISETLIAAARTNVSRCTAARVCHDIEILHANAKDFEIPRDVTVLYLYNPFHGDILRRVFENIHRSLLAHPRRIRIVVNNPVHAADLAARQRWLRLAKEYSFEFRIALYQSDDV